MRRAIILAVFGSCLCACEPPKQPPKLITHDEGGGGAARPGFTYGGGGGGGGADMGSTQLIANNPKLAPLIREPAAASRKRPKAKGRRRPADEEMDSGDMGDFSSDDDVDDSTPTPKAKENPDPEPAGPLVQRKSKSLDAAPAPANIDTSNIKPLPTMNGHVKFPPPPEGEADQEEIEEAMAAKNTKMNMPKDGAVKMGAGADLALDPNSLGSYHVQVSLTPYFRNNEIDQVYGFGTDIHLEYDLDAVGAKTGKYFIRWALIDLLDMEHPFHRPKYFSYIAPLANPEESGTSATPPGASGPR